MTDDELVHALVGDLAPVRRLRGATVRAAAWAALATGYVALGTCVLGPRPDLARVLRVPAYLAEAGALIAVAAAAAIAAFQRAVPGAERPLARGLACGALIAWIGAVALRWSGMQWAPGWTCVARLIALGGAPAIASIVMIRRAAPLERAWTTGLAILAAAALAMLGTQAVCARDAADHVLVWHVVPVVIAVAIAVTGTSRSAPCRATTRG